MDFKFYRKSVHRGSMTQKSYDCWVMNGGVDPADGDGVNRIGGQLPNQGNGRQQQNSQGNGPRVS